MTSILSAAHLVKNYPETTAVADVSFDVHEGTCFGLLGPNGAGKTTTVEMLEGINRPSGGSVLYRGQPITRAFQQVIGIQFQITALQEFLSVRETINLFRSFYPRPLPLDELVQLCALEQFIDRDTRKLSGGQRQRVLLALALVNDPEIVFLDEPTTGLDPQARRNFWHLIESIKAKNKTVLLTTHYMEEAQLLCDEIVIMDHGRIISQGRPTDLLRQHFNGVLVRVPSNAVPEAANNQLPMPHRRQEGYLELQTDDVDQTVRQLMNLDIPLTDLHIQAPNLEDLFLKLTGHTLRA